jgi:predicted phosphoribosyltransferase
MERPFTDRHTAGRKLAEVLVQYTDLDDVAVFGLPRGGIPVAYEVAHTLGAPLDVLVVRKLGVPGHEELAIGAIASGGVRVLNYEVVSRIGISPSEIEAVTAQEMRELRRQERLYRSERAALVIGERTAVVVDDGLATGATMRAAIAALRKCDAKSIIVAVPISSTRTCAEIGEVVEQIVCARTPEPFEAVGLWYRDFTPTSDAEVRELLRRTRNAPMDS